MIPESSCLKEDKLCDLDLGNSNLYLAVPYIFAAFIIYILGGGL